MLRMPYLYYFLRYRILCIKKASSVIYFILALRKLSMILSEITYLLSYYLILYVYVCIIGNTLQ